MIRSLLAILVAVLAVCPTLTWAQKNTSVRLEGGITWTLGIDADDFFRDYQAIFGGKSSSFDIPTGFYASMASYQLGQASLGLMGGYYRAVMRENYNTRVSPTDSSLGPPQNITQDMTLTCVPAMATIDFFPVKRQFTGYVGAGLGIAFATFKWTETLSASSEVGARSSGVRYDDGSIVPALMVRAGVSLGFDDPVTHDTRAALLLEGGYLYMPLRAPLMANASESFATPTPPRLQGEYAIQTGGFQLKLALAFFIGSIR